MQISQLYQYMYLIWAHCNWQCDQEHCYNTFHIFGIFPKQICFHITNVSPTALIMFSSYRTHINAHTNKKLHTATFIYHAITIHVPTTNMHLKCHIYANYYMCTYETTMSVYIVHMNSMQSILWQGALVYMFHIIDIPLNTCASHTKDICPTAILL